MYGGGSTACRRISVGESSEEWLMMMRMWGRERENGELWNWLTRVFMNYPSDVFVRNLSMS